MLNKSELTTIYQPITADPFASKKSYTELQPCTALAPYVRCFWGTAEPVQKLVEQVSIVIPDTCMDIIFHFDAENAVIDSGFCVMDENPYVVNQAESVSLSSTFGIRFYGWAAVLFAEDKFTGCKNRAFDIDVFFSKLKRELLPMLMRVTSLEKRAEMAGRYLLKCLETGRMNNNFMNAVCDIIDMRGTLKVSELSARNVVSKRQLERIFDENMGISPKNFSSLVRYQMLWNDFCYGKRLDILDLVDKYAYYDQAHLLNDFKRYHGMTPRQAIELAVG